MKPQNLKNTYHSLLILISSHFCLNPSKNIPPLDAVDSVAFFRIRLFAHLDYFCVCLQRKQNERRIKDDKVYQGVKDGKEVKRGSGGRMRLLATKSERGKGRKGRERDSYRYGPALRVGKPCYTCGSIHWVL